MAAALRLQQLGVQDRDLYLFDTFEGMTDPTDADRDHRGRSAADMFEAERQRGGWCYAPLDEVRRVMASTGYPDKRIHYVEGPVEETIPDAAPERSALLRWTLTGTTRPGTNCCTCTHG